MKILRPPRLRQGDVIGICAPASAPASADALDAGIRYFEQLGYRVELGRNLYRRRGYLAGTDDQRVADLHQLFRNRHVRTIFAARGGYGAHRILAKLDYRLIRRNPKILVGYSDITAIQLAIFTKSGLTSVSGAVVTELPTTFTPSTEAMFWRALSSPRPIGIVRGSNSPAFHSNRSTTRRGILVGGNLSLLAGLIGTSYFPQRNDLALLLEEIDERPYRVDRTLQQMNLNGVLQRARGIVLGSFIGCTPIKGRASLRLNQVFEDTFEALKSPLVTGIRYGHQRNSLTIPIGVKVLLDPKRNSLEFLESAVS